MEIQQMMLCSKTEAAALSSSSIHYKRDCGVSDILNFFNFASIHILLKTKPSHTIQRHLHSFIGRWSVYGLDVSGGRLVLWISNLISTVHLCCRGSEMIWFHRALFDSQIKYSQVRAKLNYDGVGWLQNAWVGGESPSLYPAHVCWSRPAFSLCVDVW